MEAIICCLYLKDIVVREELWINKEDMLESFEQIPIAISNLELRDTLSNFYYQALPQVKEKKMEQ